MNTSFAPRDPRPVPALTLAAVAALLFGPGSAEADTGWFALAGIGDSSAELGPFLGSVTGDERSFEVAVGYAFTPYLAAQAGWHDYGDYGGELPCIVPDCPQPSLPFEMGLDGWSLRVTGAYPFAGRFAAFASVGVLVWEAEQRFAPVDGLAIFTGPGTEGDDFLYEAGLRWRLSDRWNLQASYEKVELDIESAKLGVLFRF